MDSISSTRQESPRAGSLYATPIATRVVFLRPTLEALGYQQHHTASDFLSLI